VHSVVLDTTTAPPIIIAATDAGVISSADSGATWQQLGLNLPTVDCRSLAIDLSTSPALLRVGTYGRSCFELTRPSGPQLTVIGNLAFGVHAVGDNATLSVRCFNVGSADLHISSFARTSGSTDFQAGAGLVFPATVTPGSELQLPVQYQPTVGGIATAVFQIASDDPSSPFSVQVSSIVFPLLPIVSAINPNSGPAAGGTSVVISGSGFTGATSVGFGGTSATQMNVDNDGQITATSPSGSGAVDITVVTAAGTSSVVSAGQFTYA
jgi:hypothetical protein